MSNDRDAGGSSPASGCATVERSMIDQCAIHGVRAQRRAAPAAAGLRSGTRQGFLRRRLHRRHQGPQVAPDRRGRVAHPLQPGAPRRGRRRPAHGRRRRHPGADPAQIFRQGSEPDSASSCRSPANTRSAICSCRRTPNWRQIIRDIYAEVIAREGLYAARLARACRPTTRRSVNRSSRPSRSTCKCSSAAARRNSPRTNSSAGSTSCASRSPTRSTAGATGARRAIIRCRSPAAR